MRFVKGLPLVLLILLVPIISASVAQAGELSPGLDAMLGDLPADKPVSVLVHFANRVDIQDLSNQLSLQKATRQQRHAEIVYSLKNQAQVQDDLAADLESAKASGSVLGYTQYWITNVMVVYALPAEIERIALRADVDYVEPNFKPELIEPVEIRPAASRSEMDTRGIGVAPGIDAVRAREAWNILGIDGTGTIIGSLDTGVDGNHPSLATRWRGNYADASECWLDVLDTGTIFPVDNHGHGTHTTGTMAGIAPDDTIGIAPGALWIASNAIDQGSSGNFDNDIIECFQWFADPDNNPETIDDVPDVVQNSWGVNENFTGYFDCDDRWWEVIDNCEAAGVVVVFSAGNEGPSSGTLRSPSDRATSIYNCFSVGSTQYYSPFAISSFSSRGPTTCAIVDPALAIKPEVSAPGSDIYSAEPGGGYQYMSGTSMAGPHVAGVVALMRQANPNLEVNTIKQILMDTAIDLGSPGEDNNYGWGFIDAYAAVEACMTGFGSLSGQVINASYGDLPLAGALVTVQGWGSGITTDTNGEFHANLPAGEYSIVVSRSGFETNEFHNVLIEEDVQSSMNFPLVDNFGPVLLDPSGELATSDVAGPYTMGVMAEDGSTVSEVILNWRMAGSSWNAVTMSPVRGAYTGDIPGHSANTEIEYYFSATDALGYTSQLPANSPDESFSLLVTEIIYLTEAEDPGDPDWQMGAPGDQATAGLWVRADPVGTDYNGLNVQPEDDHTADPAVACFVTGNANAGDGAGTADVDGGCTTLQTPVFDLSAVDRAVVKYWCWYGEGGLSVDDDFVVEISNNNGASWIEFDRIVDNANSWQQVSVELNTLEDGTFELTDQILLRFLACDLNTGGLIEAAIDDFSIESFTQSGLTPVDDLPAVDRPVLLRQNHPNPFNPTTAIGFYLPQATQTELVVYTIDGRRVTTLVSEQMPAGEHNVSWDGHDDNGRQVASGAYFYRLIAGDDLHVKRMVLVK